MLQAFAPDGSWAIVGAVLAADTVVLVNVPLTWFAGLLTPPMVSVVLVSVLLVAAEVWRTVTVSLRTTVPAALV